MHTLTIQNVPEHIENQLKEHSIKTGKSLNETIIEFLSKALEINKNQSKQKKFRDVSAVIAHQDEKDITELENNLENFEKIDDKVWRQ